MTAPGLAAADEKMRAAGVSEPARESFRNLYEQLTAGDSFELPGDRLEPVRDLRHIDDVSAEVPPDVIDRAVVIKLNGGLGTSMGLHEPKSLIEVKPGHTFLDLSVRQVLALRRRHGARLPLVFMNSFSTRRATIEALERYPDLQVDVPLDFLQNREPKLRADDFAPIEWPADPELEWCPPGHGDIYAALMGSGMLETLLEKGYDVAFVSNVDNLGAILDPRILALMVGERLPFIMEAVEGTAAERKGGHIARREGQLVLREIAQVPDDDDSFTDYRHWRYYNTNTLWVDLRALAERGVPKLPLIVNRKTVDPADPSTPEVLQLETAMGAALSVIDGAEAVEVPRSRFAPVKTTNDLLVVRSDAYVLHEDDARLELAPERDQPTRPVVDLDPRYYKLLVDFDERFPDGPPSLVHADRLVVRGDVTFEPDTVITGDTEIEASPAAEDAQGAA